jgi:hypothetical protein
MICSDLECINYRTLEIQQESLEEPSVHLKVCFYTGQHGKVSIYRMSQKEGSVFSDIIVSVFLRGKKCVCRCDVFRTVSEIESLHCTLPKLFLIPVFIVQFGTVYLVWYILENSTVDINALCNSCEDMACCSSVQWNSSISETVRNRTHVHIIFLLRMTDTVTSQNIDLASLDTLYIMSRTGLDPAIPVFKSILW